MSKLKYLGDHIIGPWEYFLSTDIDFEEFQRGDRNDITGKYLFFSEKREQLVKVAQIELHHKGFKVAKIIREGYESGDFVLCLYWKDNSRKDELAMRYDWFPYVKYRYWKSDEDTINGKYSEKYYAKREKSKQSARRHH